MGWIETEVGRVGVASVGEARSGTPLVFLHGVGSDKGVWRPQLDHFGESRPCFAFDYPGYGESDFQAAASRDDFAAAILAAMDVLGIERAHICGLSLGGVIAIAMHHAASGRCASLILADSFAVHPDGRAIHDRSVDASRTIGMRALAEARAGALLGSAATAAMHAEVVETMARIDPAAYRLGAAAVWLSDQRDRARAIACQALVLVGDEDTITPPPLSHELAALIPGARLAAIPRAGHLSNLEQPEVFNGAINAFLLEVE